MWRINVTSEKGIRNENHYQGYIFIPTNNNKIYSSFPITTTSKLLTFFSSSCYRFSSRLRSFSLLFYSNRFFFPFLDTSFAIFFFFFAGKRLCSLSFISFCIIIIIQGAWKCAFHSGFYTRKKKSHTEWYEKFSQWIFFVFSDTLAHSFILSERWRKKIIEWKWGKRRREKNENYPTCCYRLLGVAVAVIPLETQK